MTIFIAKQLGRLEQQYSTFEEAYSQFEPSQFDALAETPFAVNLLGSDNIEKSVLITGANITNRFRIYIGGVLAEVFQSPTLFKDYFESDFFNIPIKSKELEITQIHVLLEHYNNHLEYHTDLWYGKWRKDLKQKPEIYYNFRQRNLRISKPKKSLPIDWKKEGF